MHESIAQAIHAGYKRTILHQIGSAMARYPDPPKTRKSWFKWAVNWWRVAPGSLVVDWYAPHGSAVTDRGKTWVNELAVISPVRLHDEGSRVTWGFALVRIDAKHYTSEVTSTRITLTDHVVERMMQRLDISSPRDILIMIGDAVRRMPRSLIDIHAEEFALPIGPGGALGAILVRNDRELGREIRVFSTFVARNQLYDNQYTKMMAVYERHCRESTPLGTGVEYPK